MTMHAIDPAITRETSARIAQDRATVIARNAASSCGIRAAAHNPQAASLASTTFDVQLKHHQPKTLRSLLDVRQPQYHALPHHQKAWHQDL